MRSISSVISQKRIYHFYATYVRMSPSHHIPSSRTFKVMSFTYLTLANTWAVQRDFLNRAVYLYSTEYVYILRTVHIASYMQGDGHSEAILGLISIPTNLTLTSWLLPNVFWRRGRQGIGSWTMQKGRPVCSKIEREYFAFIKGDCVLYTYLCTSSSRKTIRFVVCLHVSEKKNNVSEEWLYFFLSSFFRNSLRVLSALVAFYREEICQF